MDIFSNSSLVSIKRVLFHLLLQRLFKHCFKHYFKQCVKRYRVGIKGFTSCCNIECSKGCNGGYIGALMVVQFKALLIFKQYFCQSLLCFLFVMQACLLAPRVYALVDTLVDDSYEQASKPFMLSFYVDGYSLLAEMQANTQLLEKIATPIMSAEQKHYKGVFSGYPKSSIRVSYSEKNGNGHWRGVLLFEEVLYVVDADVDADADVKKSTSSSIGIPAYRPDASDKTNKTCASGSVSGASLLMSDKLESPSAYSAFNIQNLTSAPATVADVCANPINGVCLLPEIELAYDLSYQNLSSAETPMQRALRELNEMELFFQEGLGYQFSRISLTMLNTAQDNLIGASDDPNDLLDRLRILRGSNQLSFLQQSRSIFHLVTGRDFSGVDGDVVGIAYLGQVCESFGLNTGLTDAGDTSLVSLVMAHEIGHNLGADHDSIADNGCPENQYVMSASLGFQASGFTRFSSCSVNSINQTVADNLSGLCFNFPIDLGLTASLNNPVSPNSVTPFDLVYNVSAEDGYIPIGDVNIQGLIVDSSEGGFISARVEGGHCSATSSTYNCTVNNPVNSFALTVTASANQDAVELKMQHSVSTSTAEVTDVVSSNNTLNVTLHSFGSASEDDPVNESENNEQQDQEPNTITTSNGSSGGGGAVDPLGLLMLVSLLLTRGLASRKYVVS